MALVMFIYGVRLPTIPYIQLVPYWRMQFVMYFSILHPNSWEDLSVYNLTLQIRFQNKLWKKTLMSISWESSAKQESNGFQNIIRVSKLNFLFLGELFVFFFLSTVCYEKTGCTQKTLFHSWLRAFTPRQLAQVHLWDGSISPIRHLSCTLPFKTINLKPPYIHVRASSPAVSNIGHPWAMCDYKIFTLLKVYFYVVISEGWKWSEERENHAQIFSLVLLEWLLTAFTSEWSHGLIIIYTVKKNC